SRSCYFFGYRSNESGFCYTRSSFKYIYISCLIVVQFADIYNDFNEQYTRLKKRCGILTNTCLAIGLQKSNASFGKHFDWHLYPSFFIRTSRYILIQSTGKQHYHSAHTHCPHFLNNQPRTKKPPLNTAACNRQAGPICFSASCL